MPGLGICSRRKTLSHRRETARATAQPTTPPPMITTLARSIATRIPEVCVEAKYRAGALCSTITRNENRVVIRPEREASLAQISRRGGSGKCTRCASLAVSDRTYLRNRLGSVALCLHSQKRVAAQSEKRSQGFAMQLLRFAQEICKFGPASQCIEPRIANHRGVAVETIVDRTRKHAERLAILAEIAELPRQVIHALRIAEGGLEQLPTGFEAFLKVALQERPQRRQE